MTDLENEAKSRARRDARWFAATVAFAISFLAFVAWRVVDCERRGGYAHSPFLCVKRSCLQR